METKLKLVIADDEKYICIMLEKLIRFEALHLELTGVANDGEQLQQLIREKEPDIVITDISMPKMDGLDVIRTVREAGISCRFVIISGYRQFEYAYNALKYDVSDYILKPVEGEELNETLKRMCFELRSNPSERKKNEGIRRTLLSQESLSGISSRGMDVQELNTQYLTAFTAGRFRYGYLKILPKAHRQQEIEDITSLVRRLEHLVKETLAPVTTDTVTSDASDGIVFLMGYEEAAGAREALYDLFSKAQTITNMFEGYVAQLFAGREVTAPADLEASRRGMMFAEWVSRYYGCQKALLEDDVEKRTARGYEPEIRKIRGNLERAFEALDGKELQAGLVEWFSLPKQVISTEVFLQELQAWLTKFAGDCEALTRQAGQAELLLRRLEVALRNTADYTEFRDVLIEQTTEILQGIADEIRGKNALPVRKAQAYINEHYREGITLEEVAAKVNLSPAYFSSLFRKDTGSTYIDYVLDVRMEKAKELLCGSDMNVGEIAEYLGFHKARYFSKLFKKKVGVKPTDYRKIHG